MSASSRGRVARSNSAEAIAILLSCVRSNGSASSGPIIRMRPAKPMSRRVTAAMVPAAPEPAMTKTRSSARGASGRSGIGSVSTSTSSASSRTSCRCRPRMATGSRRAPVRASNEPMCQGQMMRPPHSAPSCSGALAWGQVPSNARISSPSRTSRSLSPASSTAVIPAARLDRAAAFMNAIARCSLFERSSPQHVSSCTRHAPGDRAAPPPPCSWNPAAVSSYPTGYSVRVGCMPSVSAARAPQHAQR